MISGDVLTFLDAHCETTDGWLQPLLYRIKTNPNVAVCPIIDIISDETFALLRSFELHHGGMSWNLHFRWFGASETLMSVCVLLSLSHSLILFIRHTHLIQSKDLLYLGETRQYEYSFQDPCDGRRIVCNRSRLFRRDRDIRRPDGYLGWREH